MKKPIILEFKIETDKKNDMSFSRIENQNSFNSKINVSWNPKDIRALDFKK